MANIVLRCQSLIDQRFDIGTDIFASLRLLLPNQVINRFGKVMKIPRLYLPGRVRNEILQLSYEFMDYPDDIVSLGVIHYEAYVNESR